MKPQGYRKQNCCSACRKAFTMFNYDEEPTYYCTEGAPNRPMCGSSAMGEHLFGAKMDEWDEWSKGRKVGGSCICDSFVKGEPPERVEP